MQATLDLIKIYDIILKNVKEKYKNLESAMLPVRVKISSIEDIKEFVSVVRKSNVDVDLGCEKYKVDAKSLMGIFSLDLSKPINLIINNGDTEAFLETIKKFIVK